MRSHLQLALLLVFCTNVYGIDLTVKALHHKPITITGINEDELIASVRERFAHALIKRDGGSIVINRINLKRISGKGDGRLDIDKSVKDSGLKDGAVLLWGYRGGPDRAGDEPYDGK